MTTQKQINQWYDEGQKPQKVNLGVIPGTSPWEKFIIWGLSLDMMPPTSHKEDEEGRAYAKEIGLM